MLVRLSFGVDYRNVYSHIHTSGAYGIVVLVESPWVRLPSSSELSNV